MAPRQPRQLLVVVDDDDDDAFELCSVDSPTEGCVDVQRALAPEEPRAPPAKTRLRIRRRKEPALGRVAHAVVSLRRPPFCLLR